MWTVVLLMFVIIVISNTEATCQINNCKQCLDYTECGVCNDGYYLESGGCNKCSDNCALCSESNTCDTCKTTYWNLQSSCAYKCPMDCLNRVCDDQTGDCLECIPGKYGPRCGQKCSLCRNGDCGLRQCINGCKDGFIRQDSGTGYSYCMSCPTNCVTCSNTTYCTRCDQGYYRHYYRIPVNERGTVACLQCSTTTRCISNTQCQECQLNSTHGCNASGRCSYASSDSNISDLTTTTAHPAKSRTSKASSTVHTFTTAAIDSTYGNVYVSATTYIPLENDCYKCGKCSLCFKRSTTDFQRHNDTAENDYHKGFGHGIASGIGISVGMGILLGACILVARRTKLLDKINGNKSAAHDNVGYVYENAGQGVSEMRSKPKLHIQNTDAQVSVRDEGFKREYDCLGHRQQEHDYSDLQ